MTKKLYSIYYTPERLDFRGHVFDDVAIHLFADRDKPPMAYEKAIKDYTRIKAESDGRKLYTEGLVNELFTKEETERV